MKTESQPKFAPAPYSVVGHSWSDTSMYGPDGKYMFTLSIDDEDTTEENQDEREEWARAQMALFAQAPAMYAALAKFEDRFRKQTESYMSECSITDEEAGEVLSILSAARGEANQSNQ